MTQRSSSSSADTSPPSSSSRSGSRRSCWASTAGTRSARTSSASSIVGSPDMNKTAILAEATEAKLPARNPRHAADVQRRRQGDQQRCPREVLRRATCGSTRSRQPAARRTRRWAASWPRDAQGHGRSRRHERPEVRAVDPKTKQPVANGARDIWVTETALTTALNTSFFAEQVSLFASWSGSPCCCPASASHPRLRPPSASPRSSRRRRKRRPRRGTSSPRRPRLRIRRAGPAGPPSIDEGSLTVSSYPSRHPAPTRRIPASRKESSSALLGVTAMMLGILVALLGFFGPVRRGSTLATPGTRRTAPQTRSRPLPPASSMSHDMHAGATSAGLQSYAGAAPANAEALAAAHRPYPAALPPAAAGPVAIVHLILKDVTIEIAPGVKYAAWASRAEHQAP